MPRGGSDIGEPTSYLRKRIDNRRLLPHGTSAIGWGLVANGLATYGFLVVAQYAMGEEGYGTFAVVWALVNIFGPGLFQPLEQEVARATADRASRGEGSAAVLHRAAVLGGVQILLVAVLMVAAWPLGLDSLLGGSVVLLVILIVALASFGSAELVRGILSGLHRFEVYGWYFAVEGVARFAFAALLALLGLKAVGAYGVAIPFALIAGASTVLVLQRPFVKPGPAASYSELTPALGLLLIASIGEAFMLNVGPVAVHVAGGDDLDPGAPGVFLDAMIIARVPLFFFQAVKASLLPSLADLAGRGDLAAFRTMQIKITGAVGVLAASSVAVSGWIGPGIVDLVFADEIGRLDMALLAASGGGLMLMLSLSLGLVALGHTRLAVAGWGAGVIAFAVTAYFDLEPFLRVELSLLSAVLAGSATVGALLRLQYAAHRDRSLSG